MSDHANRCQHQHNHDHFENDLENHLLSDRTIFQQNCGNPQHRHGSRVKDDFHLLQHLKSGNLSSLEKCCKLDANFVESQRMKWAQQQQQMPHCWDRDNDQDCCSDNDHCDGLDDLHCNGHFDVDTVPHRHPCHKKHFDHKCNSIKSMKSLS